MGKVDPARFSPGSKRFRRRVFDSDSDPDPDPDNMPGAGFPQPV